MPLFLHEFLPPQAAACSSATKMALRDMHLHGSLPYLLFPPPGKQSNGKAFVWMDRYLDTMRIGPRYLIQPEICTLIASSIQRGAALGHDQHHQLRMVQDPPERFAVAARDPVEKPLAGAVDRQSQHG